MKKSFFLLALLVASSGTYELVHAQPMGSSLTAFTSLTYAQGQAAGTDYAASLAAQYGYGTAEYQSAIDDASANAVYNAKNSEEPFYWRGYNNALVNY
jgi:hypothetical protein